MTYAIQLVDDTKTAGVSMRDITAAEVTHELQLHDCVQVFLIRGSDELVGIELSDTTMFGDPFDQTAAARAVEWAREQLALRDAS